MDSVRLPTNTKILLSSYLRKGGEPITVIAFTGYLAQYLKEKNSKKALHIGFYSC